jgi:hypothetical protein
MTQRVSTPEMANRWARAIASDICLYHEDKITRGLENDTLFDEIASEMAEGLELYKTRVAIELVEGANFFERAIVDLIFKARGELVQSKIW